MKNKSLAKSPTGISGFDTITGGGLPKGRPTLVCGSAGCGKTLFGLEFLMRGALQYREPGVFISFEEKEKDLVENVASLGFDLRRMEAKKQILIDYVRVERNEIEETGEYDLSGLFIRLEHAIDSVGAKRVVLDTIETLFSGLQNTGVLRAELRRLFGFLKEKGVTAVITGERGEGSLTRHGLEEYISDCVILLDHRVEGQISTRRLRVVKYRGSSHGTNEYPFLIDHDGISVIPITSMGLNHAVSRERVSSGVEQIDQMLGGKGFFRGSSILVSGTAGTGKSSLAASFAYASARRGEKCLYFAFEESPDQIVRNMQSIGMPLSPMIKKGLIKVSSSRPATYGLEMHLAIMHKQIEEERPKSVVVDPITNLLNVGSSVEVHAMMIRLIDFLKTNGVTAMFTNLSAEGKLEQTESGLSSIMDTWILLRDIESSGERNRGIYLLKSRGMAHSNQIREFLITDNGIKLQDVIVGPEGVLTGAARTAEESRVRSEKDERLRDAARQKEILARKRSSVRAQIAALKSELASYEAEAARISTQAGRREKHLADSLAHQARMRQGGTRGQFSTNGENGGVR